MLGSERAPAVPRLVRGWRRSLASCAEAVAAVDRLRTARAKWDAGLAAAAVAGRREHLALTAIAAAVAASAVATGALTAGSLAGRAAGRAASRLAELAIRIELLVRGGERELLAAVDARQPLVGVGEQENTPSMAASAKPSRWKPGRSDREYRGHDRPQIGRLFD